MQYCEISNFTASVYRSVHCLPVEHHQYQSIKLYDGIRLLKLLFQTSTKCFIAVPFRDTNHVFKDSFNHWFHYLWLFLSQSETIICFPPNAISFKIILTIVCSQ